MDDEREPARQDLRPVIARLREIERKCASMGSRNEEFPLMQHRVASIISRLEAGEGPSGESLDLAHLARELFPVAHVFESAGFLSVGREIAHVERALREIDPRPANDTTNPPLVSAQFSSAAAAPASSEISQAGTEQLPPSRSAPTPVIVGLIVLAAAAVLAVSIVLRIGPAARLAGIPGTAPPQPTVLAEPSATPAPVVALVATEPARPTAPPVARGQLIDSVSQARLALATGDTEAALSHLSTAALIDRTDTGVIEIADTLVDRFLSGAEDAATSGDWNEAEHRLERARRIAMRFALDETRITRVERRLAEVERYRVVGPRDSEELRAAVGQRVEVTLRTGRVRVGRIDSLDAGSLILEMVQEVGGGGLHYTEELAVADIAAIKIYDR
jgi:hypothetical protein